ncbi:MAG: hypothetical protein FJ278_01580, partial [Planctomycetes bacterium]|nr:hypothetical protein [Planctomycetota bacterium]
MNGSAPAQAAVLGGLPSAAADAGGAGHPDIRRSLACYGPEAAEDGGWSRKMAILLSLSEEVMREPVSEHRMVVVLLWVWAAAVARPLVAEQNLMENGGFERGEPGQLPLPWRLETGKNTRNVTVTLDETNPFAGRRALRLDTRPRDAVEA